MFYTGFVYLPLKTVTVIRVITKNCCCPVTLLKIITIAY